MFIYRLLLLICYTYIPFTEPRITLSAVLAFLNSLFTRKSAGSKRRLIWLLWMRNRRNSIRGNNTYSKNHSIFRLTRDLSHSWNYRGPLLDNSFTIHWAQDSLTPIKLLAGNRYSVSHVLFDTSFLDPSSRFLQEQEYQQFPVSSLRSHSFIHLFAQSVRSAFTKRIKNGTVVLLSTFIFSLCHYAILRE